MHPARRRQHGRVAGDRGGAPRPAGGARERKGRGPADALNKGFRLATGDLIGWLNMDDVYRPGALAKAIAAAKAHPRAAFFFGKCRIVDEAGREIRGFPTLVKNACFPFSCRFLIQCINYVSQPASWFRRSALAAAGGLRTDFKAAWDYDLTLRLWRQGGGVRIPGAGRWRISSGIRARSAARTTSGNSRRNGARPPRMPGASRRRRRSIGPCATASWPATGS
jgi:GT2 family glycosyltransferase